MNIISDRRATSVVWLIVLVIAVALGCCGCAAPRSSFVPPLGLNLCGQATSAEAVLHTVIVPGGPNAWNRAACWDEYVLTITNRGPVPLTLETVFIDDMLGKQQAMDSDPQKLIKGTVENWKTYRKAKAPVTQEPFEPTVSRVIGGSVMMGSALNPATLIFLPVGLIVESDRRAKLQKEFAQRRLLFPLVLQANSSAMGSVFFPMTAGPRRLVVQALVEGSPLELVIPLSSLSSLHLVAAR